MSISSSPAEIALPGEVHFYTFGAVAGDVVKMVLANGESVNTMRAELFSPQGDPVGSTDTYSYAVSSTINTARDSSGQSTVQVRNRGTETSAYTLSFNTFCP